MRAPGTRHAGLTPERPTPAEHAESGGRVGWNKNRGMRGERSRVFLQVGKARSRCGFCRFLDSDADEPAGKMVKDMVKCAGRDDDGDNDDDARSNYS